MAGGRRGDLTPRRRTHLRVWLWGIAAMTAGVLVVGGITRLTHSGLSIVEWQPLMGVVPPLGEDQWLGTFEQYRQSPEYRQLRQGMTLAEFKRIFFWEYVHRLLARAVGLVFIVPFLVFAVRGYFDRALAARMALLFGLGALQGVMGWLMVKSGLVDRPSVSHYRLAAHLCLAFVIFGWAVWLLRQLRDPADPPAVAGEARRLMSSGLRLVGVLLAAQVVWGAFTAGLKAGLVFNTFPLMAGRIVPPDLLALEPVIANFADNPIAVQWTHRLLGTALLIAVAWLWYRVARSGADRASRRLNAWLVALVAGQYALGVLTLVGYVPVPLAVGHQALALVIAGVWVAWVHHVRQLVAPSRAIP